MRQRKSLTAEREVHHASQAVVFRLTGRLTGTKECYEFLEDLRDEIHAGNKYVVLNLEQIVQVSSPGIGIIAACYTSASNAGGHVAVVGTPQRVRKLLEVVCLWDLLGHPASEEEALAVVAGS